MMKSNKTFFKITILLVLLFYGIAYYIDSKRLPVASIAEWLDSYPLYQASNLLRILANLVIVIYLISTFFNNENNIFNWNHIKKTQFTQTDKTLIVA